MIAAYVRVSSHTQKADSQKAEISRWLQAHGHNLSKVQWFEDIETGKTIKRSAFEELQKEIFAGQVKTVVVWKLDRLARNLVEGVNVIADWCDRDVRLVSVTQQLDLSGPIGKTIASLLFGLAEIELQHIKERQAAGIAVAKQRGVYTGRKKGTTKSKPERAQELKARGLKVPEIANALNVSERTIFRYLRSAYQ